MVINITFIAELGLLNIMRNLSSNFSDKGEEMFYKLNTKFIVWKIVLDKYYKVLSIYK